MSRVLITPRSLTSGGQDQELARLEGAGHELIFSASGRQPTSSELAEFVPRCEAWLAGVERIDADILTVAHNLRIIARFGVGLDSIDLAAAERAGIAVVPSTGSNADGVAELVVLHALLARRPFSGESTIDDPQSWNRQIGSELQRRHAAVVGYGAVGSRVARLLDAFGMHVSVFDPFATPEPADLLTLHCPPDDAPLIGRRELDVLAPGATFVNTARGSLVDMDAVLAALESGHLGAYSCDAFSTEPPAHHDLWHHPRVTATPHIGGFTVESVHRSVTMAVDAILVALG